MAKHVTSHSKVRATHDCRGANGLQPARAPLPRQHIVCVFAMLSIGAVYDGAAQTVTAVLAFHSALPLLVKLMHAVFWFLMFLIWDTGAGAPIFWIFVKPLCGPFVPTPAYSRLKRKHSC